MKPYKLVIKPEAFVDIQEGISWYDSRQEGLGTRFLESIEQECKTISLNPHFQIRYDEVRCLPMKAFPYMIHFIIDDDLCQVVILGVINTSKNPVNWKKRRK
ncbi:MAG TPA: hypothetical protein PKX27_14010 [Bacteroidales bacterium]|nr:hypothetical protein [Bacteroidales bacterium]HOX74998.1 hypothetical protein [Bacteroidales bacterium]HPM89093.1 hypothetical protein [Bacteroidales bacterium]HQM68125.1 hypothetical protein [Bacteroidales bacterium]